ncbi:ankyrin repeat and SOCS box protein 2 isoform X1 [Oncorhynchus mykiss]|uniref:ankyrin repeat and SOCS box protein 2 isoform X1 n=2 Tax=Oncorhynchus mykiss TaxID=8022 RepID=UPI001877E6EB|nr:ankyrin repeat and SOCS box protein 2 isoform X1 [Oncorhynchus mykiss]XP_021455675.2 ankyrin repeat and SOCS box protein 2 isoform X1 [Oncorhynchus mykiss]XP_021455676.2 ankyrin repeat and SOCS box protein 2 isoform X1 [Oncorhynchus mykiss]
MAVARKSMPGSTISPTLGFDDYTLYSNLSDDELMQLAIERSLSDPHNATSLGEASKTSTALGRRTVQFRANPPTTTPNPSNPPREDPSHRPPTANPPDARRRTCEERRKCGDIVVTHFVTGNGKRMLAYHRGDGSIQYVPDTEKEQDPIVKAILNGDVTTVRAMARNSGNNILRPDKYGWIPLHEAAYYGQDQCVRVLLGAQPGVINTCDLKGRTALILAVESEKVACVEALLEMGADPDLANKERESPLYKGCEMNNAEIVAMLLNHGAMVNKYSTQGWTALLEAVSRNNVEICEMLVRSGAKLNPTDMYGITPLSTAAQNGHVETLQFLIKHGADVNSEASDGSTALYEAAKNGHEDIVEILLSQKAVANKVGKKGLLPLHIAAQQGNDGIVSLLIKATSKSRVKRSGISPLHLAAEYNWDEVLEVLIKAGYDVNAVLSEERSRMYEDHRRTALYFAVTNGNVDTTTMLLEAGADPNLDTFNPLLVAMRQGSIELVTLLVEHMANVNAYIPTHPTSFPATVMFSMKYLSMLKYLMDNGCDALSCFSCTYSSGPHPPLQETSERDGYNTDMHRNTGEPVQFCEIISTRAISRWAGPIIDVLLDYVGQVKLCSRLTEHLDSFKNWEVIKEKATPPRPLMQLCRLKIRQKVGIHRLRCINKLPLPQQLIKYLNHEECNQEQFGEY